MTVLSDLLDAKVLIAAAIKAHAGTPDYVGDGRTVSWSSLQKKMADINDLIAAAEGPWEEESIGT